MIVFDKHRLINTIIRIYENRHGKSAKTEHEKRHIIQSISQWWHSPCNNNDDNTPSYDPEIEAILRETKIADIAHAIRIVVMDYLYCLEHPSEAKWKVPLIKEKHNKIIEIQASDQKLYKEAVQRAYYDMFESDMRILGPHDKYIDQFHAYVSDTSSLDLSRIKHQIPQKYLDAMDPELFSFP